MKNTKIIATIGPAATNAKILESMINSGPFIARLNFSHGSFAEHGERVDIIRKLEKKLKIKVPIFQDLCGPKLRLGNFTERQLAEGQKVVFGGKGVPIAKPIWKWIKAKQVILIDDGVIELVATKVGKDSVEAVVTVPGLLRPNKGVSLPGIRVDLSSLQPKDISDLEFAITRNLDAVAFSFVKTSDDVRELRKHCARLGRPDMYIIAKIETIEAIANIKAIIKETDAVMIARGDLAVNMNQELVPLHQKMIIAECKNAGVPVITATQMLESMTGNPRPTRAEMSDVANAVWDGTDAVMLSGETANGKYPAKTVETMREIVTMAENSASKVTAWRKLVGSGKKLVKSPAKARRGVVI
jgi:pyruvate kinase